MKDQKRYERERPRPPVERVTGPKGYEHLFIENIEKEQEAKRQYEEFTRRMEEQRLANQTSQRIPRRKRRGPNYKRIAILCALCVALGVAVGVWLDHQFTGKNEEKDTPTSVSNSAPQTPQTTDPSTSGTTTPETKPAYQPVVRAPQEEELKDPSFFSDALFLGDSITTGLELYDVLVDTPVVASLGMGLRSAKDEVPTIQQANPKRVFMLMGINDLADYSRSVDQIAADYVEFYKTLRDALPETTIYVEGLFPIAQKYDNSKNQITNEKIDQFNAKIREGIDNNRVYYVDLSASLKDENGQLHDEVTLDGMHLKKSYYGYWMNLLMENVKNLEAYYQ